METTRLIEEYLDNALTAEERSLVEARAASDKNFNELIHLHREVNESIRDKELIELSRLLARIGDKHSALRPSVRKTFFRIAATVLILAGSAAIIRIAVFNKSAEEKIFNRYYEVYTLDATSRSGGLNSDQLKAMDLYASRHYGEAIALLDKIITFDKQNYNAWFYRGLANIELENYSEAISSFRSIPDSWDHLFGEHRNWYLALALLKSGNTSEAEVLFGKIRDQQGFYSKQAEEVLVRLSS